jgi:hypothetical protein
MSTPLSDIERAWECVGAILYWIYKPGLATQENRRPARSIGDYFMANWRLKQSIHCSDATRGFEDGQGREQHWENWPNSSRFDATDLGVWFGQRYRLPFYASEFSR